MTLYLDIFENVRNTIFGGAFHGIQYFSFRPYGYLNKEM